MGISEEDKQKIIIDELREYIIDIASGKFKDTLEIVKDLHTRFYRLLDTLEN